MPRCCLQLLFLCRIATIASCQRSQKRATLKQTIKCNRSKRYKPEKQNTAIVYNGNGFSFLFLSIYFAIFFSNWKPWGRRDGGKGKRKGNKENNALATYDDDNGEKWKTLILIDAILMAKRWGNLKLYDSLCWFNAVAVAAKWEIRSVYARFKASLITIWAAGWEAKKYIASGRQRQNG